MRGWFEVRLHILNRVGADIRVSVVYGHPYFKDVNTEAG